MNWAWRIAALKNGFQDATAYRFEFLFEILGAAAVPVAIQLVLWYSMFTVGGATEIGGMTHAQLIQYTLVSALFTQIRGGDLDFELQEMIRTGQLSNYLVRPVGVVEFAYIRGSAPRFFVAGVCLLLGLVVGSFYGLHPLNMVAATFMAIIGNIIHYQISAALATSAFYWEEAFSVLMVKNMVVNLLSGELIPLSFFPQSWSWVWKSTPFYLYVYGPTQIATGAWTWMQYWHGMGAAAAWLLAGWVFIRFSWTIGIRRYVSIGG